MECNQQNHEACALVIEPCLWVWLHLHGIGFSMLDLKLGKALVALKYKIQIYRLCF